MTAAPVADIGVVVVSYQSITTLPACLTALQRAAGVAAISIVDNGSTDGSLGWLQQLNTREPRLRLSRLPHNPGFGAGCNQGAALLETPWLAFVNPDVEVTPDTLARLRNLAAVQPRLGVLGACLHDAAGQPDDAVRRRDLSLRVLLQGRGARASLDVSSNGSDVQLVEAVSGALLLMPREVFLAIGGFDTGYRLHVEDLDLCRRVRASGHAVAIANTVSALHHRGVSSQSRPLFVEWHKHRGLWRYWWRHEARGAAVALAPLVALVLLLRFVAVAVPRVWWMKMKR